MEAAKSELQEFIRVTAAALATDASRPQPASSLSSSTARALGALESKAMSMLDRAWNGDVSDREAAVNAREQKAAKLEAELRLHEVGPCWKRFAGVC